MGFELVSNQIDDNGTTNIVYRDQATGELRPITITGRPGKEGRNVRRGKIPQYLDRWPFDLECRIEQLEATIQRKQQRLDTDKALLAAMKEHQAKTPMQSSTG